VELVLLGLAGTSWRREKTFAVQEKQTAARERNWTQDSSSERSLIQHSSLRQAEYGVRYFHSQMVSSGAAMCEGHRKKMKTISALSEGKVRQMNSI
jgi:hypothetical protein